jgi:hypothetical protein
MRYVSDKSVTCTTNHRIKSQYYFPFPAFAQRNKTASGAHRTMQHRLKSDRPVPNSTKLPVKKVNREFSHTKNRTTSPHALMNVKRVCSIRIFMVVMRQSANNAVMTITTDQG